MMRDLGNMLQGGITSDEIHIKRETCVNELTSIRNLIPTYKVKQLLDYGANCNVIHPDDEDIIPKDDHCPLLARGLNGSLVTSTAKSILSLSNVPTILPTVAGVC